LSNEYNDLCHVLDIVLRCLFLLITVTVNGMHLMTEVSN